MSIVSDLDVLAFFGEPFDAGPSPLLPSSPPAPAPPDTSSHEALRQVRAALVDAHASAMRAQAGLLRLAMATDEPTNAQPVAPAHRVIGTGSAEPALAGLDVLLLAPGTPADETVPQRPSSVHEFKPLAHSTRSALSATELRQLAAGEIDAVFGSAGDRSYDQQGVNPAIALSEGRDGGLVAVTDLDAAGGRWGQGWLTGRCVVGTGPEDAAPPGLVDACWQAAQVLAMRLGLHLCVAGARFEAGIDSGGRLRVSLPSPLPPGEYALDAEVRQATLVPRPQLVLTVRLIDYDRVVAELTGLTLTVREGEGVPVGPVQGGLFRGPVARRTTQGEPVLLNEFHMAHASIGDLGVTMGPEFHRFLGRRATRMPDGGLRLCDRVLSLDGTRGELQTGAAVSEYDSPANSWYYREYASATMPNAILMETSLQSALMMGYFLGATLVDPDSDYSLRNLDGRATVLRQVDLRDATIRQRSRLLETTVLSDTVLQSFAYELSVDGEPFYVGESLFGYFTAAAMENQTGLDGGRSVPTWLEAETAGGRRPAVRTVDIAARTPEQGGPGPSRGHLALISAIEVVDGGGQFGQGYLRAGRPIRDEDWYFGLHFHLDPVMPGSLGIEAVVQALQEWAVDAGLLDGLRDPQFVLPCGLEFAWTYRGQILASDGKLTLEAHIKRVERGDGRVRVVADASVFKPGMRIYGMTNLTIEAHSLPT